MAFFNSRKRQGTATLVVEEPVSAGPAPAPEAVSAQSSPAPLGGGLRLVSAPTPEPTLRLAPAPASPEIEEDRAEDLRGLPLGTILYRQGLLQQDVLENALLSGMESGERLGEILIRQGLISQDDIARALAAQRGLEFVPHEQLMLNREVAALLPVSDARELGAVPVRADGDTVFVVTADPTPGQKDALEARLHRPVSEAVVSKGAFDSLLQDIEYPHLVVADVVVPADDVPEHDHESEEEVMDQVWTGGDVEETVPEAWAAEPVPQEEWQAPFAETVVEHAQEHVVEPVEHEPAPVVADEVVRELSAQHEASVGRIGDLLSRIEEGASTFTDLRARLGGLSESLRVAEESVADRDRRLAELTGAYEAGERRIEELVAQVHEREEELRGVGARVEDMNGRLASAEERLDDRERRLEELFRQVERRDSALSAFEAKLDGIAAQFAGELQA
jgi:type II secretion system (T2SS) protein E